MKWHAELAAHLGRVRPLEPDTAAAPDGFAARVLAARMAARERARAFTGTAAVAALVAVGTLGALTLIGPSDSGEHACAGWLEMEQQPAPNWE